MERLEEKSIYHLVAEAFFCAGRSASLGISPVGFDASFDDGVVLHYDRAGRLTRIATPNVQWRRGLSHQTLRCQKRPSARGGGLQWERLDEKTVEDVLRDASLRLKDVTSALDAGNWQFLRQATGRDEAVAELKHHVRLAAAFDVSAARDDRARFVDLYGEIPILPPDQYRALVLLATEGCAFNQCTFCGLYRGTRHRLRTVDEFRSHVEDARAFHGEGLTSRRGVFLGQANALVGPAAWREDLLRIVNEYFEFPPDEPAQQSASWWQGSATRMESIGSFLDAFTGVSIEAREFARLRQLHLRRLYVGVETGDPALLKWLRKPATPDRMRETVVNAKSGGIQIGVMILVGAGGERFFDAHVEQTVAFLHSLPLGRGDFIYLSPLVEHAQSDYGQQAARDGIESLTPRRLADQEQLLRDGLSGGDRHHRPYVARYDVSSFVY